MYPDLSHNNPRIVLENGDVITLEPNPELISNGGNCVCGNQFVTCRNGIPEPVIVPERIWTEAEKEQFDKKWDEIDRILFPELY